MEGNRKYVKVIVPLRFRDTVTYSVPDRCMDGIRVGSRVDILLANKPYKAIVQEVTPSPDFDVSRIREIIDVDDQKCVSEDEITFWKTMADYYMCSVGEVLKAASPILMEGPKRRKSKNEVKDDTPKGENEDALPYLNMKILTSAQQEAYDKIKVIHKKGRTVLLDGVTSSGKTEIYLHAVKETLEEGKNALVLIPDIASGRKLIERFTQVFGPKVILYHNQMTLLKKKLAIEALKSTSCNSPAVVISTRSGIFLPLGDLGLLVVSSEHDSAYKQSDPAPRYNGRDAALILAKTKGAKVILGSSTPSFESLYNAACGKYVEVSIEQMHPSNHEAAITIIDTIKEKRKRAVKGSYTDIAAKAIAEAAEKGYEVAVFKPRNSFGQDDSFAAEIVSLFHNSGIGLYSDIQEIEEQEKKPDLIVVLQGEALLNSQDFRGDEKAIQTLTKLKGILEKGGEGGHLIIQTSQISHNAFRTLTDKTTISTLLKEREKFGFPPYTRMIQLSLKDKYPDRLERRAADAAKKIVQAGIEDFDGPTPPPFEKIPGESTLIFRIKLKRDRTLETLKKKLLTTLETGTQAPVTIDVDPL